MNNFNTYIRTHIAFLFLFFILINNNLYAQVSNGGTPPSFSLPASTFRLGSIPMHILSKLDTADINQKIKEARKDCKDCRKEFYGKGIDVNIDVIKEGIKQSTPSGTIWQYKIKAEDALGIQVYFEKFELPEGASFFIYNEDRSMILGAFTSNNNKAKGKFAVQPVRGNLITLEYFEPSNASFNANIKISKIIHAFKDLFERSGQYAKGVGAAACNIDVACPLGSGWNNEIRSVGLILYDDFSTGLQGQCSGALINNVNQDTKPYFLTANHCISTSNYSEWVFLFNHQDPICGGNGSNAPTTQSVSGSRILSRYVTSDYALLELYESIPATYNACFAGWDNSETGASSSTQTTGIHHPQFDTKKISRDDASPVTSSWYFQDNAHWAVSWDQGITETGSSGSPLFNSSHRIIGQLHGGQSDCSSPQAIDQYGKFSKSWVDGNLYIWLSPFSSTTTLNTYCPVYTAACQNHIKDGTETGIDCGGTCPPCAPSCTDGKLNQDETAIDCGGSCPVCPPSCSDYIWNQGETGVDCGGPCPPCPVPTCSDHKKNQNETGIDCGGVCPPCSSFCTDKILNGDEMEVDCGGSCTPCFNNIDNGTFENTYNCVRGTTDWEHPFTDGSNCMGPWRASHGHPLIRYWTDGTKSAAFYSQQWPTSTWPGYMTESDGLYYQLPFNLSTDMIYTFYYKHKDYFESGYLPMSYVAIFATRGLQSFNRDANYTWTEADVQPPTYPFDKYKITELISRSEYSSGDIQWVSDKFEFTVPDNIYNQIWLHATFNYSSYYSVFYVDDIILTARPKPCVFSINYNNTSNVPDITKAQYIMTHDGVKILQGQHKLFRAVKSITLDPGFESETNSVWLADILPCSNDNPTFKLDVSERGTINTQNNLPDSTGLEINVYPNPSSGIFKVEVKGEITNGKYVLYNSIGQLVYEHFEGNSSNSNFAMDITNQPRGIYILNITSDNFSKKIKVVIE